MAYNISTATTSSARNTYNITAKNIILSFYEPFTASSCSNSKHCSTSANKKDSVAAAPPSLPLPPPPPLRGLAAGFVLEVASGGGRRCIETVDCAAPAYVVSAFWQKSKKVSVSRGPLNGKKDSAKCLANLRNGSAMEGSATKRATT